MLLINNKMKTKLVQVSVQTITGVRYFLEISLSEKIKTLREIIASKVDACTENWYLNFQGVIMLDEKTFK